MLTKLTLERFKNFRHAELMLGPVTTLIGTNASGKSNLRDAFRFLHGIGRGYNWAEIMGEKYGEGGERVWSGIRGGLREIAYLQAESFRLTLDFSEDSFKHTYSIEVNPNLHGSGPQCSGESLYINNLMFFDSFLPPERGIWIETNKEHLQELLRNFITQQPFVTQIFKRLMEQFESNKENLELDQGGAVLRISYELISTLNAMRFFEFSPDRLRLPSFPGQTTLGDRGENLSSVLQAICDDPQQKQILLEWLRELTPMDVCDFEFVADQTGKILLTFVEEHGRKMSIFSASDGTLRFLGILAALLGPRPPKLFFFEELENGLHPSRLHLLLQLMEQQAAHGEFQIINTTHSPQFLRFLSPAAREYASIMYRLPESPEGRIKRLLDIPDAPRVMAEHDIANLHESGWFENAVFFSEEGEGGV